MASRMGFEFGTNIRNLRKSRGFSQDYFARTIGSNQMTVSSWEVGTRMPTINTIMHIAEVYHILFSSLISIRQTGHDEDCICEIAELLQISSKFRTMFDRVKFLNQDDLDLVIALINRMINNSDENDTRMRLQNVLK